MIHDCHEALILRDTGDYVDDNAETIRINYPKQKKIDRFLISVLMTTIKETIRAR